ncbi:peptide chain release factor 1, partial [Methanocaldococcus villosus KIN24-T80]
NEATIALVKGRNIQILKRLTSGVPGKFKAGGQSARRLERLIDLAAHEFLQRVGQKANEQFLPLLQEKKLKGILVGGPGHTKLEFVQKDYLHHELKKLVLDTFDLCYTEEFGIRELLEKAAPLLKDVELMKERQAVQRFLKELVKEDGGLACYGEKEVLNALMMGAVDTLIVSEDIERYKVKIACNKCDYFEERTVDKIEKMKLDEEIKNMSCPKCGSALSIVEEKDYIEYLSELCEQSGAKLITVSSETEEGAMISKAFKGIAAILRYKI